MACESRLEQRQVLDLKARRTLQSILILLETHGQVSRHLKLGAQGWLDARPLPKLVVAVPIKRLRGPLERLLEFRGEHRPL